MPELIEFSNGTRLTEDAIKQLARHCSYRRLAECLGISYIELMVEYAKHRGLDEMSMDEFREHLKSIER
jgi:hypothetical protein